MAASKGTVTPGVSLRLGSFTTGGAGLPEGDYILNNHRFLVWDYDGKLQGGNTLALAFDAQPGSLSGGVVVPNGESITQYYSAGDPGKFSPNETGTGIIAVGNAAGPSRQTNLFVYLENLVNAGFPEDRYDNDVSVFNGMHVHIHHIPQPKRDNMPQSAIVQTNTQNSPDRARTIPVVSTIHKLPWDTKATGKPATTRGRAVAAPAVAAPAAASTNGHSAEGAEYILREHLATVIADANRIPRLQARLLAFQSMKSDVEASHRTEAMKIFNDDNALGNILGTLGESLYEIQGADIVKVA